MRARRASRRQRKQATPAKTAQHRMVAMGIPPNPPRYQVSPFTAKVIALQVSDTSALVFTRQRETIAQIAGKVGAAIKAAQRRDPERQFIKRRIDHNGRETFAIWRVR